ncbi:MAG: bifunctional diguanylate cyclase/phosphodiesterase [Rhizobacter sp.]|nr:bifunctional diguanylate cyclase/phosphodiesterase [Rhizobacter sp.]
MNSTAFSDLAFIAIGYSPRTVVLSVLIAIYASYVALDLAKRVRTPNPAVSRTWLIAGTLVMGSGIWAMHFVGMFAAELPFEVGYDYLPTIVSWVAAALTSGLALWVASREAPSRWQIGGAALAMGGGISAMHYLGMSALDLAPGIRWDAWRVAASVGVAVLASYAALTLFIWVRDRSGLRALVLQGLAAVAMGLAISGMHYIGMSAAQVALGSVCRSANAISGSGVGTMVAVASLMLLTQTLLNSLLDAHVQHRAAVMAESLSVANRKLQHIAFHDALTQLPNRLVFEDRLAQTTARCDRDGGSLAVLFIDLDGFKPINDSFGHVIGDAVLQEMASRLKAVAGTTDTLARIGGDEFAMLVTMSADTSPVAELADRIVHHIERPVDCAGRSARLSSSIGIAVYPQDGPVNRLIPNADSAMYTAKRAGGAAYKFFESHMDAGARAQLELLTDLRVALQRREFEVVYQPKVHTRGGQITGTEALMRWNHPSRGVLESADFIPIAERFGLIDELGGWLIDDVCRQMQAWRDQGLAMRVAVNLSPVQLRHHGLAERIETALERHGVSAGHFTCEITESAAMEEADAHLKLLDRLHRMGVQLAIDDFGTGSCRLSHLRKLPVQQLKIDPQFVADIETHADARAIVDAAVRLAHALGMKVVAEGVESAGQRSVLLELGCDEVQGSLLGQPMPAEQITRWAVQPATSHPRFRPSVFELA